MPLDTAFPADLSYEEDDFAAQLPRSLPLPVAAFAAPPPRQYFTEQPYGVVEAVLTCWPESSASSASAA